MENMPKITPAELRAAMSKAGKGQWTLVDTNSVQERKTYGVIKGAVKLSSVRDFDVEKELPKKAGTTLVFYGVDQDLYEPFIAARRAQFYEYDVRLLTGGIKAWKSS